jgi:uncharacterized protein (DUF1800 family)
VRAEIVPAISERQLAAHVLNRLAYGHTPYELGRILGYKTNNAGTTNWSIEFGSGIADGGIGVDAWIAEQLDPASITEDVTNQFAGANGPLNQSLAQIAARFGEIDTVILTNKSQTNEFYITNGLDITTNYVTNINHEVTQPGTANLHDFRAWYAMHCIGGRRQLQEVMLYWLENHFVSQWTKARETFQGLYNRVGGDIQNRIPTKLELEEHKAFRSALMRTNITFRELLRLQHESTSMTVYLDTNDSFGNGANIANENYAREIQELYGMGVDNGYDQGDITAMSVAWTGWDVRKVSPDNAFDLYSYQADGDLAGANSNNFGVYVQQFNRAVHGQTNLYIWYERDLSVAATGTNYPNGKVLGPKFIPSRFNGSGMTPSYNYADKDYGNGANGNYSLLIGGTTNNNASRDAMTNKVYTIMDKLANLPFTQEYISVKLCQLLVHDDFHHGYDFSDGFVTPEEQLIWECLITWKDTGGQIYQIIKTITDSPLFRSEAAYRQKIKTPLEFTISAVRALRTSSNETYAAGSFTSDSEGFSIVTGSAAQNAAYPLNRMGLFLLFDRAEPDGYPETGTVYVGANGIVERVRWVNSILDNPPINDGINGNNQTRSDPYGLILRYLGPGWHRDADAVARLFIRLIFPGEGSANVDQYRLLAINQLNTADGGGTSLFSNQTPGSTTYDDRVRRMVAGLLSMQRFNEQ